MKTNSIRIATVIALIFLTNILCSRSLSARGPSSFACCGFSDTNSLVFTAFDMDKNGQNPDTSFNNLYSSSNFNIRAWSMKPSNEGQQVITLMFGLPTDIDVSSPLSMTFYFFIEKKGGARGDVANIRIQADTKGNLQELSGTFASTLSTDNFQITEPSTNKTVENMILTVPVTVTAIQPGNWMLFAFDRIAPTGTAEEYSKDIYLTGIVLQYTKAC